MQYDLAFEGGGAKGAVFVGALEELEARGHTARRFVGTSAGAVTATLTAAGYSARELRDVLSERLPDGRARMTAFMDIPERFEAADVHGSLLAQVLRTVDIPLLPDGAEAKLDERILSQLLDFTVFRQIFSLLEKGGLYAGDAFRAWISEKLDAKRAGLGAATFREFARATGSDVSLVASDTTGQEMLVLNERTAPDCPIADAVRMSMSLPFVWQEVEWPARFGAYRGRDITGHVIVDGGVLSNFPIQLLTTNLAEVVTLMGDTDPSAVANIGFLIDEELPVDPSSPAAPIPESFLGGLLETKPAQRIQRLVDTMMNAHVRLVIERCMVNEEICRLPAQGYGSSDFGMSKERLDDLVAAGRRAARDYFDRREQRER